MKKENNENNGLGMLKEISSQCIEIRNQWIEIRKKKEELEEKVRIEEISITDEEKILAAKEEDVKTLKIGIDTNKAILKENKNQCDICRKDEEKLRKQMHDYWNKGHGLLDSPINQIEEENGILIISKEDIIEQPCVKPSREEYKIALLEILYDSPGGKAILKTEIYPKIERKFNLCPLVYDFVPSWTDIKWENDVRQARRDLVDEGLMKESVVAGVYEISEKGRRFVENIRNKRQTQAVLI